MLSCYFFHSLDWFIKTDNLFHYVAHNNLFTYDVYIKKQTKLSRISFLCSFSFSLSSYFSPQFSQSLHFIFEVHMLVPVISIMHFSRRLKFESDKSNYRPERSCGKVMFLHLSVIFHGGVCHTSPGQTSPPPAQCMLGYGQQAGSLHPTGIHSC